MKRALLSFGLAAAALAASLYSAPAQAQATRTWVSGVGDDVNPCSRTAPCKTFAGAISKTATNGAINCLDPGGFGSVTITKSISIDCSDFRGAIAAAGVNGVIVNIPNPGGTDTARTVHLRGLTIDGFRFAGTQNGIRILNAASVVVEDVVIRNFTSEGITAHASAPATPVSNLDLVILNSTISSNVAGGIAMTPPAGVTLDASLSNVRVVGNAGIGLRLNKPANGGEGKVLVDNSIFEQGGGFGIRATGSSALIRLSNTVVIGHTNGLSLDTGAEIVSFGNNVIIGNTNNGSPTSTVSTD